MSAFFNLGKAVNGLLHKFGCHIRLIPGTCKKLEDARLAFAHIDVNVYSSVMACCRFIYPRLVAGGMLVFDDYGLATCPGARKAADDFFADTPEKPIALATGQALVIKLPEKN